MKFYSFQLHNCFWLSAAAMPAHMSDARGLYAQQTGGLPFSATFTSLEVLPFFRNGTGRTEKRQNTELLLGNH